MPPQYREISHKNISTRCNISHLSHFDAGNPGCLSRDFSVARARSGAGDLPPLLFLFESNRLPVPWTISSVDATRIRRGLALVAHTGCTRVRTCIGLKNGPIIPFFFSTPIEESIFRTTRTFFWTSAHRFGTAFIVFRSDSDRGWPTTRRRKLRMEFDFEVRCACMEWQRCSARKWIKMLSLIVPSRRDGERLRFRLFLIAP